MEIFAPLNYVNNRYYVRYAFENYLLYQKNSVNVWVNTKRILKMI